MSRNARLAALLALTTSIAFTDAPAAPAREDAPEEGSRRARQRAREAALRQREAYAETPAPPMSRQQRREAERQARKARS